MNNEPNLQPQENEQSQIQQPEVQQVPIQQTQMPPVIYVQQPVNQPVVYVQPPAFAVQPTQVQAQQTEKKPGRGKGLALSIIGLIMGIESLSYFFACIFYTLAMYVALPEFFSFLTEDDPAFAGVWFEIVGETGLLYTMQYALSALIPGIIGIILSALGKKSLEGSKLPKAGLVTSIFGTVATVVFTVFLIVIEMI